MATALVRLFCCIFTVKVFCCWHMLFTILTENLCFDKKSKEQQAKKHQMTRRLSKKRKTSSSRRFLVVKESYNFAHYSQLSEMFISVTPLRIWLQKFQHPYRLRTRQCNLNSTKSWKRSKIKILNKVGWVLGFP